MGIAIAKIEVNIIIILLILVGSIHVGVITEVVVCSIGGIEVVIIAVGVVVVDVVMVVLCVSRLGHGGSGLWCRGSRGPSRRLVIVAAAKVSEGRLWRVCCWVAWR